MKIVLNFALLRPGSSDLSNEIFLRRRLSVMQSSNAVIAEDPLGHLPSLLISDRVKTYLGSILNARSIDSLRECGHNSANFINPDPIFLKLLADGIISIIKSGKTLNLLEAYQLVCPDVYQSLSRNTPNDPNDLSILASGYKISKKHGYVRAFASLYTGIKQPPKFGTANGAVARRYKQFRNTRHLGSSDVITSLNDENSWVVWRKKGVLKKNIFGYKIYVGVGDNAISRDLLEQLWCTFLASPAFSFKVAASSNYTMRPDRTIFYAENSDDCDKIVAELGDLLQSANLSERTVWFTKRTSSPNLFTGIDFRNVKVSWREAIAANAAKTFILANAANLDFKTALELLSFNLTYYSINSSDWTIDRNLKDALKI